MSPTYPAFVPDVNGLKCSSSSALKSKEPMRQSLVEEEPCRENGANCDKKDLSANVIDISDNEDDELLPHGPNKRKREYSDSIIKLHDDGGFSNGSLNQSCGIKKLKGVLEEPPKHGQSVSALDSKINHDFSTPQKLGLAAIRKCEETISRELEGSKSHGNIKNDDSEAIHGIIKRGKLPSPRLREFMARNQEELQKKALEDVTDMKWACRNDPEFSAKAVCAIYRQHKSRTSSPSDLISSGSKGFEDSDVGRGTTLAEFLIDGDSNFDMKKSIDELRRHDPRGPDDCKNLAGEYAEQLFEIFKNNKDLFSPPQQ